jgi:transcriptional regulator with XRE-family HTH domain
MRKPRIESTRQFYLKVGRRIAEIRNGKMTQEALAKELSLTRTSVINIEKGRQQILLHTLIDIARILQVSPIEFLPGETKNVMEELLRTKPKKAREWIKSAVSST